MYSSTSFKYINTWISALSFASQVQAHTVYQRLNKLEALQMGLDLKQNADDPAIYVRWALIPWTCIVPAVPKLLHNLS
jgi:hypothetical protein